MKFSPGWPGFASSNWLVYIRADPLLKPWHGDPRFEALANKIVLAREFGPTAAPK